MSTTVVIVDDHPDMRLYLGVSLSVAAGLSIVGEGGTGVEAIALATELQPDLLVLDHLMPEMAGADAIPAIRAASPETCIVMFSASDLVLDLKGEDRIPDAVVTKTDGTAAITAAFELWKLRREEQPATR